MEAINKLINILNQRASDNPKKKLHPQIEEKINYISSPTYKMRLMALGQSKEDAQALINERIDVLKNTELRPYKAGALGDFSGGGRASKDSKTDKPYISYDTSNPNSETIIAHELGHLTSGVVKPYNKYYPYRLQQGKETLSETRQRVEKMLSEGTAMYMSPKEEMLFNLQNKNLNELPIKGYGIDKMTGGKSLNDYFYNSKTHGRDWPLGTNVDVSEPEKPNNSNQFKSRPNGFLDFINNEYVAIAPLIGMKKSMNLTRSSAYNDEFYKEIRDFGEQGIPKNQMATSLASVMAGAYDPHDYSPTENKADLDAVRHLFKKYNYTKSYGDDITPALWDRALKDKKINSNQHLQRMRKNFDDKAIINLNNRVASNEKNKKENNNA
jgi:hypothetical protein